MPVFKTNVRRNNPIFTKASFVLYFPNFTNFLATEQGGRIFDEYKPIANQKVLESAWGVEWKYGMSLVIAHYLVIWARTAKIDKALGTSLSGVASMGNQDGLLTSWTVGEISKSYDHSKTMLEGPDAAFWNQTPFGRTFYTLWKQHQPNDGIFVVV
jgi:hypothetical protein